MLQINSFLPISAVLSENQWRMYRMIRVSENILCIQFVFYIYFLIIALLKQKQFKRGLSLKLTKSILLKWYYNNKCLFFFLSKSNCICTAYMVYLVQHFCVLMKIVKVYAEVGFSQKKSFLKNVPFSNLFL